MNWTQFLCVIPLEFLSQKCTVFGAAVIWLGGAGQGAGDGYLSFYAGVDFGSGR